MNQNGYNAVAVYGLLVLIGVTSGAGDILLYKWAKSTSFAWLAVSYLVWLLSLTLLGLLLRLEHFSFGAAIVLATIIHLGVGLAWSFLFTDSRPSRLELAGLVLAVIAVILIEVGRTRPASDNQ